MRILLLSQHFTPEVTAARVRMQAFAEGLADSGHEVEVICAVPNHPEGVVREGYRGRPVQRRRLDGFTARYVWVYARPNKTTRNRLLFYGSYAAMATIAGIATRRADAVVVTSPPLPAAAAAVVVAARHRAPLVLDVRDLWPEVAVVLGELSDRRVIRWAERLERWAYKHADAIVTVTEPFRDQIAARVDDPAKVHVIPNGTTRQYLEAGEIEVDRGELGLPADRFVWTYAGNVGIAQGLEAAIDAAKLLDERFRLVILGVGPRLAAIKERAEGLPPGTVEFRGLVEPDEAIRFMRASDALLVPLDRHPGLASFVPSKLFDCCAVQRPVIVAAAGEARRLPAEADAALGIEPGDPRALAEAVRGLHDDAPLARRLAERGHAFAAEYLREQGTERLERLIANLGAENA